MGSTLGRATGRKPLWGYSTLLFVVAGGFAKGMLSVERF